MGKANGDRTLRKFISSGKCSKGTLSLQFAKEQSPVLEFDFKVNRYSSESTYMINSMHTLGLEEIR